jgi:hypothetical protein
VRERERARGRERGEGGEGGRGGERGRGGGRGWVGPELVSQNKKHVRSDVPHPWSQPWHLHMWMCTSTVRCEPLHTCIMPPSHLLSGVNLCTPA